jgi:hypothetical protein
MNTTSIETLIYSCYMFGLLPVFVPLHFDYSFVKVPLADPLRN